jgi:hypothetical protein
MQKQDCVMQTEPVQVYRGIMRVPLGQEQGHHCRCNSVVRSEDAHTKIKIQAFCLAQRSPLRGEAHVAVKPF